MLSTHDLTRLNRWCTARKLRWAPANTKDGDPAILLQSFMPRLPWEDTLLVEAEDGLALIDTSGGKLAMASEIPALLDALDAGLARSPIPALLARLNGEYAV